MGTGICQRNGFLLVSSALSYLPTVANVIFLKPYPHLFLPAYKFPMSPRCPRHKVQVP